MIAAGVPLRLLTLRPMRYPVFFDMYKNAIKNTWTVDEIDFSDDLVDLDRKLMPAEKHLVSRLVAFFATGDSIVSNNLVLNLYQHINAPEARMYLSRQLYEEALHQVSLGRRHAAAQVGDVGREVDLLDRPGVLDGRPVHLEELRVRHRPQRQAVAGIEDARGPADVAHSHASQCSGFSSEQAIASASVVFGSAAGCGCWAEVVATVALAMRVAGRERR